MAKVQIKNEKITPFGGIYFVTKQFKPIERAIDEYLGRRCVSVGYQYGEIVRAMMGNFFCGGDRLYRLVCRVRIIAHSLRPYTTCRPITRWGKGGEVLNRVEIPASSSLLLMRVGTSTLKSDGGNYLADFRKK